MKAYRNRLLFRVVVVGWNQCLGLERRVITFAYFVIFYFASCWLFCWFSFGNVTSACLCSNKEDMKTLISPINKFSILSYFLIFFLISWWGIYFFKLSTVRNFVSFFWLNRIIFCFWQVQWFNPCPLPEMSNLFTLASW